MSKVSQRFILEPEVRDSTFFLSLIPCVVCVKCGRVFHLLSKVYVLFCLLFSVMFGFCFFAVYTSGTLFVFVNEHRSPVKRNSCNTLFLMFALVGVINFRSLNASTISLVFADFLISYC